LRSSACRPEPDAGPSAREPLSGAPVRLHLLGLPSPFLAQLGVEAVLHLALGGELSAVVRDHLSGEKSAIEGGALQPLQRVQGPLRHRVKRLRRRHGVPLCLSRQPLARATMVGDDVGREPTDLGVARLLGCERTELDLSQVLLERVEHEGPVLEMERGRLRGRGLGRNP
jgi:hypothetical protein